MLTIQADPQWLIRETLRKRTERGIGDVTISGGPILVRQNPLVSWQEPDRLGVTATPLKGKMIELIPAKRQSREAHKNPVWIGCWVHRMTEPPFGADEVLISYEQGLDIIKDFIQSQHSK